ncbi:type VII secretion target [Phytomonospora endophytica]|uniref:Uncharacterized protein YukE n=1 Tax=Phytomonospora endophytica TaxID=714109 RepID=A0A841FQ93_9ACTN|nr:type VII secretion target [Phytomonospora endophytica]MBB6034729.1 uncharacterized protein YukE [Phytomonospora endophytica]GIG69067.1 hypothetical protein Pen01_53620 [Phytomonospora endophytica]
MSTIEVDFEAMHRHARTVTTLAGQTGQMHTAAEYVRLGDHAFGAIHQPLAAAFEEAQTAISKACADLRASLEAMAKRVEKSADAYELTETGNKSAIKKLRVEPR